MKPIFVLLCVAPLGVLPAQPREARDERAAVLATVERMFHGMRVKDTAAVRAVFHPSARLVGMRTPAGGASRVQLITVDEWVAYIARDQRGEWIERAWDPEVRIDGTLATIWAAYDFHFGATFSHCGIDAVQLLRTAEGWRIMSIADTYTTEGCTRRPPPAPPRDAAASTHDRGAASI